MIDFFKIPEQIARRMTAVNDYTLERLGKDIARVRSLNNYRDAQLVAIKMTGESVTDITSKLSNASGMTAAEIEKLYEDAARYDYEFAEQFYLKRNIEQVPFEQNEALRRTVNAMVRQTAYSCSNFSGSYAFALRDPNGRVRLTSLAAGYKEAIDKAVTSVRLGVNGYDFEMRRVLKQYADSGLRVADWESGYSQRLDSAVRRNIMDGLRQLSNEEQKLLGDEFGADGYEISAHVNPAPDHAAIQGRQYSKADYEALNESLERKIGTLNCYHTITAIVLGVSTPVYSAAQLDEMKRKSEELIDIGGRKYTRYECTQLQRQLETAVSKAKDRKKLFEAAGDKEAAEKEKRRIRAYKEKYDAVTKAAGLDKHTDRMSVPRTAKSVDFSAKSDIMKAGSETMTINSIEFPIEQRNTGKGNANAVLQFNRPLNNRQKALLEQLPTYNSEAIVNKSSVKMSDLATLTALTGNEFALFTKGNERLVVRGNEHMVDIDVAKAQKLASEGYKWSGHTHPGSTAYVLFASDGDKLILKQFRQSQSVIYNSKGQYNVFGKE